MKKILVLVCLFSSMALYAETLKTDNPNRYFKNFICHANGNYTSNLVNKTNKFWHDAVIDVIDSDGDPIDFLVWATIVSANSGKKVVNEIGFSSSGDGTRHSCLRLFNNKTKSLYKLKITTR